jgi:hypothetical protein
LNYSKDEKRISKNMGEINNLPQFCSEVGSRLFGHSWRGSLVSDTECHIPPCKSLNVPPSGPLLISKRCVIPSAREEVWEIVDEPIGLKVLNLHLCRLCVASRPEIDMRKTLEPLERLQISLHDESGQKDDKIEYIKSVVYSDRKMPSWRENDKELVIQVLSEKADGM